MIDFSAAQIAELTNGTLTAGTDPALRIDVAAIATDSRELAPGGMYVAKAGENADGHDFLAAAFAAGAVLALAERAVPADDAGTPFPAVIVADAVLAMGTLAAAVVSRIREHSALDVIGITGSAGKTTTKDLLQGILSQAGETVAPVGSYNGEVGVPLTVFRAVETTRYLIIEMGATKMGQISYLANIVHPDLGVVLGVGSAHAGEFGSIDNIATAKGELVAALAPSGRAVLNFDDGRVRAMAARSAAPITFFSSADAEAAPEAGAGSANRAAAGTVQARGVRTNADGHPEFDLSFPGTPGSFAVSSRLLGLHHVANLLAAAATAHALGVAPSAITDSLNSQGPVSRHRMERTDRSDGVTVINDAYNANPESMRAALRTLAELGGSGTRRTWAVLGEMLELGTDSVLEHDLVGRVAVRLNISRLLVVGAGARAMHVGAVMEGSWGDESMFVPDADAAEAVLRAELAPGDIVLFKSSNGAGLRFLGDRIALPTGEHPEQTTDNTPGERTAQP
ncbi:UDP-N-acetylmuramoyl-tripeptide--D-alanyl-D-alanine ligase [Arthrobacter stackebrandtii]|uniref:UDP-N-acetylmuramoyl-tripeptide--D-alanyl-D-alanine ligase n=1 Tax=Arthrobacter stackebrandtii TaxID=272161 RepID=A0ABS4Z1Q9_9MICC|nr:UDP-N-acetylmuramoyl-tripeptide--D-alanyl-D-alanine ligase [Arthrobacter stackebrandtii]MBP2414982.1 UDP-N-acetylmuramoyl-tripeptide--D-alanyl-D-alanine ligase [Arthrobacter stackebrandtii]PYH00861.1 UDP-N-acetylmuramoyl-tripeptide--D-alanyl-D-alanine ligase [Arthrobacter stackebrandtii]